MLRYRLSDALTSPQQDAHLQQELDRLLRPDDMSNANELADIDAALEAKRQEIRSAARSRHVGAHAAGSSLEERSKTQESALQERDRMLRQREEEMIRCVRSNDLLAWPLRSAS